MSCRATTNSSTAAERRCKVSLRTHTACVRSTKKSQISKRCHCPAHRRCVPRSKWPWAPRRPHLVESCVYTASVGVCVAVADSVLFLISIRMEKRVSPRGGLASQRRKRARQSRRGCGSVRFAVWESGVSVCACELQTRNETKRSLALRHTRERVQNSKQARAGCCAESLYIHELPTMPCVL